MSRADGEHGLVRSLALHLAPGLAILAVYVGLAGIFADLGFHAELALYAAFAVVGIPLPLWIMARARGRSGGPVAGAMNQPIRSGRRWILVVAFVVLFAGYLAVVVPALAPWARVLREDVFGFVPGWFANPYSHRFVQPTETAILVTLIVRLLIDGVAHPVVEELYFRGFLMPRLLRFGWWAPVLSAVFFAAFHLWQPQKIPATAVMVLPWLFVVWGLRSVRLSIVIHCLGNSLGAVSALADHLQSA